VVSGLDPSALNGGLVTVSPVSSVDFDPFTVPVPASGDSGEVPDIPVGTYSGAYQPPANHALAPGETNPKTAEIRPNQLTTVTWTVVAAEGTVRVTVTGLASGAASGGSASILRTDIAGQSPVVIAIPGTGSADLGVTVGSYAVTYTPPSDHTLNPGVTNPQNGAVSDGGMFQATFAVSEAVGQGTVRVTVTGLEAGAPSGGSASVLRTDIGGQSPVNLPIPTTGTADLAVSVGTYSVTYTPPSEYTVDSGVQNPQTLNVTASQVSTATFAVSATGSFATPDVVNNASFESGWENFHNGSFNDPSACTRDNTRAFAGSISVLRALPVTDISIGGALDYGFYAIGPQRAYDRLWTRFYFYLDAAVDGTLKFHILFGSGYATHFGGVYLHNGFLGFDVIAEWNQYSVPHITMATLSSLIGAWHSVEVDYWRNGDPSGYPSLGLWLDGVPITSGGLPGQGSWVNGRVNVGERATSDQISVARWLGVLNGAPANTVAGNVWVDRLAISSVGRIGP
jgi:hypothetical protein